MSQNFNTPAPYFPRGVYGFVLWLGCYLILVVYLVWAFVPGEWLRILGFTYWPQKYWAVAIPVFVCVGIFVFATCLYPGINFLLTEPLNSPYVITDEYATEMTQPLPEGCIPPISDVPISDVCRGLYIKRKTARC